MESATDAVEVERVQTGYDPEVKREKIQREREKFDRMMKVEEEKMRRGEDRTKWEATM